MGPDVRAQTDAERLGPSSFLTSSLASCSSPYFFLPFTPIASLPLPTSASNPAIGGLEERCKLLQRVRVEPCRPTVYLHVWPQRKPSVAKFVVLTHCWSQGSKVRDRDPRGSPSGARGKPPVCTWGTNSPRS